MVAARSNVYVNLTVPTSGQFSGEEAKGIGCKQSTLSGKVVMLLVMFSLLTYKFPVAALWITTKLCGALSASTSAAGHAAIKAATVTVNVAEQAKNAAEVELARRLIVNEALAALTPCSMLRCTSEMEDLVQLLGTLKQAQHKAAMQADSDFCSPIKPTDEEGRYLLATAAPWLIQQPQGRLPRSECTSTISSHGDIEETCKYETNLVPCRNAVTWPKLALALEEPLKILNQNLADKGAKQKEKLIRMLSSPGQGDVQGSLVNVGELRHLMEAVLVDNTFVPADPRPSTVRVTPYRKEPEVKASVEKTMLQKMEVLRKDQNIKPHARFCKKDGSADSSANFCSTTAKNANEKLLKAIEIIEAPSSSRWKLGQ
jgi:hypothetical protein